MNKTTKATLIGFCAIILWSSIVGLIKEVSHSFGPVGGSALMYSVASVFLIFTVGWVPLKKFPKQYLIWGGILMVAYEVCLALSIGYSQSSRQAIEIGMVNYLWPTFTMVSTVIFHTKKANWLIFPGVVLSMLGIVWVLGGEEGLSISQMLLNIQSNPLSYGLAFLGACLWSAYCVVTMKIAKGTNGITLFFMMVALVLWIKYLVFGEVHQMDFNVSSIIYLILASVAMGFGYAAWNVGIIGGNVTLLTGASYFIPVLSSALSSVLLSTALGLSFWQGALMVCIGSVLCWLSAKNLKKKKQEAVL
ncbi:MAG: aromatic amino acid DMT transporter YddG [Chryseobacterium sp.]|jgi:drug/metabolite transporter (DMT)-like permease|uniref:aromatic amino acid DMT transporter YddG n=1 Tax=Chryseobacterium sp. TaxID=1871047 RepID=UPI00283A6B14|nr:aromatic amino acid DMT transporter YddG [Chryseobacterium sp.]MDR2238568.1 aromatic amino acid DMT transporter YddG [Chryseobacterium sp.]